jgi:hypothetical protein
VLDHNGHFTYINAGYNLAILARTTGETEMLTTKSLLLGAFDFVQYKPRQTRLSLGEAVVICTDGVTEAVNAANEMFGDDWLEELIRESVNLSAEEITAVFRCVQPSNVGPDLCVSHVSPYVACDCRGAHALEKRGKTKKRMQGYRIPVSLSLGP